MGFLTQCIIKSNTAMGPVIIINRRSNSLLEVDRKASRQALMCKKNLMIKAGLYFSKLTFHHAREKNVRIM